MNASTGCLRLSNWSGTASLESHGIGSSCALAIRRSKSQRILTRLSSAWKATRSPSPQSSPCQGEEDASALGEGCSKQKTTLLVSNRELAGRNRKKPVV